MSLFYYAVSQDDFEAAFGGLTAEQAAELMTRRRELTSTQREVLNRAAGGSDRMRFDPRPVGHIAFVAVGTRGCENRGWHLLEPATLECLAAVRKVDPDWHICPVCGPLRDEAPGEGLCDWCLVRMRETRCLRFCLPEEEG